MAVHIRLTRCGARKAPFYRIIVTDSRNRRDGAVLEKIGLYNPLDASGGVVLDRARLEYWKSAGAAVSPTVERLAKRVAATEGK